MPSVSGAVVSIGRLARRIRMHLLADPQIVLAGDGYSIVQLISESHITLHTQGQFINIDVFSCRPFPVDEAVAFCVERFGIVEVISKRVLVREFGAKMQKVGEAIMG
jgi:S-adenosylmethionine/arginine decarboxylase-like enzyme